MKENGLKTSFFIYLRLFTAFFRRKNRVKKMAKSKDNPLIKWPKNDHFSLIFFAPKNHSKWLKMKENGLKQRFLLIQGFLRQFLVEKIRVKKRPKGWLTPYKNDQKMTIFR